MLGPGDFISGELHAREVELSDGVHTLYFRELSNAELRRYAMWQLSEDDDVRAGSEARLVQMALVEPDGQPAIDAEQALKIKLRILLRLARAALEVNEYYAPASANGEANGDAPGNG